MSGRKLFLVIALVVTVFCATPAQSPAATALDPSWQRGANVTSWWHDAYAQPKADQQLARLRANGTTHASLIATWYMNGPADSHVAPDPQRTPTDASLQHAIAKATSLGMSVEIKPHVDLRDGSFRGAIGPANVATWFADYRTMIDHYADLSQQAGAEMLMVGTELTTMSPYEDQWRALIADVRSRFDGKLTFAANHIDGAKAISFWDALDSIGIDAYMPLSASDPDPSTDALANSWCAYSDGSGSTRHYFDELAALHLQWNRPVLFTELGYESRSGAALTPWGGASGAISQQAQADAYEAAYRVWSHVPWFNGIYWWNWDAGSGNDNPASGGFEFAGKEAETRVAAWNSATTPGPAGPPCAGAAADEPTKGSLTLSLSIVKRKHGRASLRGLLQVGARPCSQDVIVSVEPRSKQRGRATRLRLRARVANNGRFTTKLRGLRSGRYRANAGTSGARCGSARSADLRFRMRSR